MPEITLTTTILVALTVSIVSICKKFGLDDKLAPVIAIIIGIILSISAYYAVDYTLINTIIGGLIIGLTSVGLYSGTKNTKDYIAGRS